MITLSRPDRRWAIGVLLAAVLVVGAATVTASAASAAAIGVPTARLSTGCTRAEPCVVFSRAQTREIADGGAKAVALIAPACGAFGASTLAVSCGVGAAVLSIGVAFQADLAFDRGLCAALQSRFTGSTNVVNAYQFDPVISRC